ncbi:MAG TPA: alpha-amylase, partial [Actinomycetota bacterium]|nr:alpha-amylase [Actinomycetota bacterium]
MKSPRALVPALVLALAASTVSILGTGMPAVAEPATVTIAGSLQSEVGCPGDWMPDCAVSHLAFDAEDGVWQATFAVPAGSWEYKAALNDSWDENYGLHATPNGPNIPLVLGDAASVKFYYDDETHWATDNKGSVIATVPGSFQSELGCGGDWDPSCLRSWLQDPDGDGVGRFSTSALPPGSYYAKVAIDESWDENYGAGGVPN